MPWQRKLRRRFQALPKPLRWTVEVVVAVAGILSAIQLILSVLQSFQYLHDLPKNYPRMILLMQSHFSQWLMFAGLVALVVLLFLERPISKEPTRSDYGGEQKPNTDFVAPTPVPSEGESLPPGFRRRRQEHRSGSSTIAPHVLWLELEISTSIRGHLVKFFCSGPVYREACSFQQNGVEFGRAEAGSEVNSVFLRVPTRSFSDPGILTVEIASISPLEIRRIEHEPYFDDPTSGSTGGMPLTRGGVAPVAAPGTKVLPTLSYDGDKVTLAVSNKSPVAATFAASMQIEAGPIKQRQPIRCTWWDVVGESALIPSNETREVLIAQIEYEGWLGRDYTGKWILKPWPHGSLLWGGVFSSNGPAPEAIDLKLTLSADPALEREVVTRVRLQGDRVFKMGEDKFVELRWRDN
jgi:hypothetical protein